MAQVESEPVLTMDEENNSKTDDKIKNENLESDLVVSSLFLVVAEPLNVEQKDLIFERIVTELSNWDCDQSGCDLNQKIQSIQNFQPISQDGDLLFKTELGDLQITTIINPRVEMVADELHTFMLTPSKYKYLLHSGPVFMNSGAWLLSDGVFTFQNFCQVLKKAPVMDALIKPPETLIDLSFVRPFTEWTEASFAKINPKLKIRLIRPTRTLTDESGLIKLSDYISPFLSTPSIGDRLQSAPPTGNITFDQPTAYIFPAGQGDSFLFGVTGFTILIDGGYSKTSCFYNLVRHLVRLDAVIMTRLSADNTLGLSSFFEKQALEKLKPALGTVMLNIGDARHKVAPADGAEHPRTTSGLVVSLAEEGRLMAEHLSLLNLSPSAGLGFSFVNLYYKVGHGSLDMYVISPHLDSKEFKDFLHAWSKAVDSYKGGVPVSDSLSISCVMLWKPAAHSKEPMVRMLFPGRIPAAKLAEGLEKLKTVTALQTHTGAAPVKKASSGVRQPVGGKPSTRKEGSKSPSSSSLDKTLRKVPVETKKAPFKKPLNAKPASKVEAGDVKNGKDVKTAKAADVKGTKSAKPEARAAASSGKPPAKTTARPLKTPSATDKKDVKPTAKSPKQPEKLAAKKSPKVPQAKASEVSEASKTPLKSDKKTPPKTTLAKSAEKKKSTEKTPDKKDSAAVEQKSPEKQEEKPLISLEDSKSPEGTQESPVAAVASDAAAVAVDAAVAAVDAAVDVAVAKVDGLVVGTEDALKGKEGLSEKEKEKADEDKEVEEKQQAIPPLSDLHNQFDPSKEWEAPLGLPSPSKDASSEKTPAKSIKKPPSHDDVKAASRKQEVRKAPLKPVLPFYVDLAYIPPHADLDFFRRVRASYYVLSSSNPDHNILPHLIDARATWNESEKWEVLVVPTHQSKVLLSWLATLNDRLAASNIKVSPPASRCSVAIREPDLVCDAYRIPFI